MKIQPCSIEPLEPRIAPAVVIAATGHSATYTDVDGDKVTITVSSGTLSPGGATSRPLRAAAASNCS